MESPWNAMYSVMCFEKYVVWYERWIDVRFHVIFHFFGFILFLRVIVLCEDVNSLVLDLNSSNHPFQLLDVLSCHHQFSSAAGVSPPFVDSRYSFIYAAWEKPSCYHLKCIIFLTTANGVKVCLHILSATVNVFTYYVTQNFSGWVYFSMWGWWKPYSAVSLTFSFFYFISLSPSLSVSLSLSLSIYILSSRRDNI